MKDVFICSPEQFYDADTQTYIETRCRDSDKQWIYGLIAGSGAAGAERVFIDAAQWMLCKDIHPGRDMRYLVIFKDLCLTTIRALDSSHLTLLREVRSRVRDFLLLHHSRAETAAFEVFFHYMPSVYQLHAHVSAHSLPPQIVRRHYMRDVVRNIAANSAHYQEALILTTSVRKQRTVPWATVVSPEAVPVAMESAAVDTVSAAVGVERPPPSRRVPAVTRRPVRRREEPRIAVAGSASQPLTVDSVTLAGNTEVSSISTNP